MVAAAAAGASREHSLTQQLSRPHAISGKVPARVAVAALFAANLVARSASAPAEYVFPQRYAARRSDYYLRQALMETSPIACHRYLEAAVEISANNATIDDLVQRAAVTCGAKWNGATINALAGAAAVEGAARSSKAAIDGDHPRNDVAATATSLQLGNVRHWGRGGGRDEVGSATGVSSSTPANVSCPATPFGGRAEYLFSSPTGFAHASEIGFTNWRKALKVLSQAAITKFKRESERTRSFTDANNHFFGSQIKDPEQAMQNKNEWPELYGTKEYAELAKAVKNVCSSYLRKIGAPLSDEEESGMEVVTWAAVYPPEKDHDPVTHLYHAHQESIVSLVLYAVMPEPTTPLMVVDPRGAPPIEDFEWFQELGDLGFDARPPFHRLLEFYPSDGDIIIFPSFLIHKVPPHIGKNTRVVFPSNCHLPKRKTKQGATNPFDGWERTARLPRTEVLGSRREATPAYLEHADMAVRVAHRIDDPYMKAWEGQNQVLAMLQFAPSDARVWVDAGNVTAHLAVILVARGEGDYFDDARAFWARALHLDASIWPRVEACLPGLFGKNAPEELREGFKMARKFVKRVRVWQRSPPSETEFIHFLHPDINGPGKCRRTCPSTAEPRLKDIRILQTFGTQVFVVPDLSSGFASVEERVMQTAVPLLWEAGDAASRAMVSPLSSTADGVSASGKWRRREDASLIAVLCDVSAEVMFADPRGVWPGNSWSGTIPESEISLLGAEPKAPFHWHSSVVCSSGEALFFPAWLFYQALGTAVRSFAVTIPHGANGTVGWRLPRPPLLCLDLPTRLTDGGLGMPARSEL
eukprot:TRINITY_DN62450_c0_g1_i1.p1 TRINITY_DN62450_c0_g1~~TRINITY_DN62450_c0_g1_i1.p1  ORF type:complete len:836 (-),score=101.36 TRINITY_DN62450_c0_g1_i1:113-2548(-)